MRRALEHNGNLGNSFGQALACPDVKRNICPTPVIDLKPNRRKGLCPGTGCHSGFIQVSSDLFPACPARGVLSSDRQAADILRRERTDRMKYFCLLASNCVRAEIRWRLHCHEGQELHNVVLNHIPQRTSLFVVSSATAHSDIFSSGYLHISNKKTISEMLNNSRKKPKDQYVLHCL